MGEATDFLGAAPAAGDELRTVGRPSPVGRATATQPPTVTKPSSVVDDQRLLVDDQPIVVPDAPGRPARVSRMRPLLRRQSGKPEELYRYLAQDTVRHLRQHLTLSGA